MMVLLFVPCEAFDWGDPCCFCCFGCDRSRFVVTDDGPMRQCREDRVRVGICCAHYRRFLRFEGREERARYASAARFTRWVKALPAVRDVRDFLEHFFVDRRRGFGVGLG